MAWMDVDADLRAWKWLTSLPRIPFDPAHPKRDLRQFQLRVSPMLPDAETRGYGLGLVEILARLPGTDALLRGSGNSLYQACKDLHSSAWSAISDGRSAMIFVGERQSPKAARYGHTWQPSAFSEKDTARLFSKVVKEPEGCWRWTACINDSGYGYFWSQGKMWRAHRWSYAQFRGPIPEGLTLDHLCRNRWCCNPEHLEAVTAGENVRRGESSGVVAFRTNTCYRGHGLTADNVIIKKDGTRFCKACARDREVARWAKVIRQRREQNPDPKARYDERSSMTWAAFRTSNKFHRKPPHVGTSARIAWDMLAADGEIVSMRLLDGLWMCKRTDGELDHVDAAYVRQKLVESRR